MADAPIPTVGIVEIEREAVINGEMAIGKVTFEPTPDEPGREAIMWTVIKCEDGSLIGQLQYDDGSERVSADDPKDNDPWIAALLASEVVQGAFED